MTTTVEYALMAGHAYRTTRDERNWFPAPQDWLPYFPVPDPTTAATFPVSSGFEAISFQRGSEIVISYAGTDPSNAGFFSQDMQTNFALVNGNWTEQLLQAAEYYLQVKASNPGAAITLTGHSLGGGLAALIGVFFDARATTFDQAPFAKSASPLSYNPDQLLTRLSSVMDGSARRYSDAALADLTGYLQLRGPDNPIPRSGLINTIRVDGEILDPSIVSALYSRIGNPAEALTNSQATSAMNLHSQALLTAFLQSELTAPSGQAFNEASKKVPSLLGLLFDKKLYAYSTDINNDKNVNFLDHLVRHEAGGIGGVAAGGDAMLTRFTADLNKLGTTVAGLNKQAQDTIIAQGIEWYYWQGKDYAGKEFLTQTGALLQYTSAVGAGLEGALDKAAAYAKRWLEPIADAHSAFGVGTSYAQWNVNTSAGAVTASALDADKSQIFLGRESSDTFTGGNLNDVLLAAGGDDTLDGGKGDDKLYGGAGTDTYRFTSTDLEGWGTDIIGDTDGVIQIDADTLSGGKSISALLGRAWISDDKKYQYQFKADALTPSGTAADSSGTLVIHRTGRLPNKEAIFLNNWSQGKFGIFKDSAGQDQIEGVDGDNVISGRAGIYRKRCGLKEEPRPCYKTHSAIVNKYRGQCSIFRINRANAQGGVPSLVLPWTQAFAKEAHQ